MQPKEPSRPALSRRENEVAALVAEGLTNREIAARLFISERTVDWHLERVRDKLAVNSRTQVAAWFVAQSRSIAAPATAPEARRSKGLTSRAAIAGAAVIILALASGAVALWLRAPLGPTKPAGTIGTVQVVWSTNGADYPFSWPGSVSLGDGSAIYVLDRANYRVQKLDAQGAYLTSWGGPGLGNGQFITYCQNGSCPPTCTRPTDLPGGDCWALPGTLAVDHVGRVWVFDYTGRVQAFDPDGSFLRAWGQRGTDQGEFADIGDIAFDSKDNLVISDGRRIQRFTPDGRYLGTIGASLPDGQCCGPSALAIDSHDNIYAIDQGGRFPAIASKLLKYDSSGRLLWSLSSSAVVADPGPIAVDSHDNVWVVESLGGYLKKLDPAGHLMRAWSMNRFLYPFGIAVDANGFAYVIDIPGGEATGEGRLSKLALQ